MTVDRRLLEDGSFRLLEDGGFRLLESSTPPPASVPVPNVVGGNQADAAVLLTGTGLTLGTISSGFSQTYPAGVISLQSPTAGTLVGLGTAVSITLSLGPQFAVVPDLTGLSPSGAANVLQAAGLTLGDVGVTTEPRGPLGTVVNQSPPAGAQVAFGSKVNVLSTALIAPFDVDTTVISQYANSPTLMRLVKNMAEYIDPRANMTTFYNYVWNVDTAQGFGLDFWGKVVGVPRLLKIVSTVDVLGFENSSVPPDWAPWNQGTFFRGNSSSQAYLLPDNAYRILILTKALANIVATTAPAINQLLRNLFPGRGRCYVTDNGGMSMSFVFEFELTPVEYAILTQSGALPHPAGVAFNVIRVPNATFGFEESGASVQPFDQGVFFQPAL